MAVLISDVNLKEDFIELKNTLSVARNISGWTIIDTTKTNQRQHKFVFPDGTKIYGKATLRLWSRDGADKPQDIYWNRGQNVWNNPGDRATVHTNDGKFVDEQTFGYGIVEGHVKLGQPSKPIKDAEISADTGEIAFTETDGFFSLRLQAMSPRGADRKLTAKAKGYATKEIVAGVWVNQTTKVTIALDDEEEAKEEKVEIDLSIVAKDLPNPAYIKEPYKITITFRNDGDEINYFESYLYENRDYSKYVAKDSTGRNTNTNETILMTHNVDAKDWTWYHTGPDTLGYIHPSETEKTFDYDATYFGKIGTIQSDLSVPTPIGSVNVVVTDEKLNAVNPYNAAHLAFLSAVTAIALALAFSIPTGGASLAILPYATAALIAATTAKGIYFNIIKDPLEYDKNFKNIYELPAKKHIGQTKAYILANAIHNLGLLIAAQRITHNRLYSAKIKKAKKYVTVQSKKLKWINKELKLCKNKILRHEPEHYPQITVTEFTRLQNDIGKSGLPKALTKILKESNVSRQDIILLGKVLPNIPNKIKYRDLNRALKNLIRTISKT